MGLLQPVNPRLGTLGPRGACFVAIVGIHALAVFGLLHLGVTSLEKVPEAILQSVFIDLNGPEEEQPDYTPELEPPPVVEIPPVLVDVIQMPTPPTALTQAAVVEVSPPAPPRQVQASFDPNVPKDVEAVEYLEKVSPRYPSQAKKARAQGKVLVRVIIGPDGKAREARIEHSSGYSLLDEAARDAALRCLYRPYRENGIARSVSALVPFDFKLT